MNITMQLKAFFFRVDNGNNNGQCTAQYLIGSSNGECYWQESVSNNYLTTHKFENCLYTLRRRNNSIP